MQRVQQRALVADVRDVDRFVFDEVDARIAEGLMRGCRTIPELSDELSIPMTEVQKRLYDPVRCGWISRELRAAVQDRLGNVLASVHNRAVATGDPAAARLLLEQYGELGCGKSADTAQNHLHLHFEKMTDGDLNTKIAELLKKRGTA